MLRNLLNESLFECFVLPLVQVFLDGTLARLKFLLHRCALLDHAGEESLLLLLRHLVHVREVELGGGIPFRLTRRTLSKVGVLKLDLPLCSLLLRLLIVGVIRAVSILKVLRWERFVIAVVLTSGLLNLSLLSTLIKSCFLPEFFLLTALRLNGTFDAQFTTLELEVFLCIKCFLHFLLRRVHHVADAFAEVGLGVSDKSNVLNRATVGELAPQFFLADHEGEISDENCAGKVLPGVHAGVATTARYQLVIPLLLLQTASDSVHSQVL